MLSECNRNAGRGRVWKRPPVIVLERPDDPGGARRPPRRRDVIEIAPRATLPAGPLSECRPLTWANEEGPGARRAACVEVAWWPMGGPTMRNRVLVARAVAICRGCPVRRECAADILELVPSYLPPMVVAGVVVGSRPQASYRRELSRVASGPSEGQTVRRSVGDGWQTVGRMTRDSRK